MEEGFWQNRSTMLCEMEMKFWNLGNGIKGIFS